MKVWKYALERPIEDLQIPSGHRFLAVGAQGEHLVIWVLVNPENPPQSRKFYAVGTGHDLPLVGKYRGTAQMGSGLVWHIFEESV